MIGTEYTSELLGAFAKSPRLCRLDVKVAPDGREIAFYSRQYAEGGSCATTVFDAEERELATYEETVVLPADSVVEWLHTTSDDPWLRLVEPA